MYGFLILLPLTLTSVLIGYLIASSPQLADYVTYVADIMSEQSLGSAARVVLIASHVASYAVLCFVLMATVRTISAPLPPDRPVALRVLQKLLEAVFVAVPSVVLLWINGPPLGDGRDWIYWLTLAVLCAGLVTTVWLTWSRRPLELYTSSLRPLALTKVDMLAALCLVAVGATVVAFALFPVDSAHVIGLFPVLMLAAATALLLVAAVFCRRSSPVAVISVLGVGVLALHLADQALPRREFRYRPLAVDAAAVAKLGENAVAGVKAQRKMPDLATAFHQWLEHRRPAIEAYKSKGSRYPVFFVSAQGGGIYAAYHPAVSLARLTDHCPEFAHHLFGIASVSGGSLGAAVFAELLRTLPPTAPNDPASPSAGCTPTRGPSYDNVLQTKVQEFFKTDFLSPVIASAFIFDVPSLFIPQLRFGRDRAQALELAFETGWRKLSASARGADGLASNFLDRWEPTGLAPALFMATTGVNHGIPLLVSQIDWSYSPRFVPAASQVEGARGTERAAAAPGSELLDSIRKRLERPDDQLQVGIANILDFRPDLQLATSTAVGLSARFPFVTPPGAIEENPKILRRPGSLFEKTEVLELTDGGFYDNSGSIIARDVIGALGRLLDRDGRFKDFRESVKLHLIRFTNTPAKRQGGASETGHFELVTPFVALDAVRLSRSVSLANPPRGTSISNVYLLDEWYGGTLNWLLSRDTKEKVEQRASWLLGYKNDECCEVRAKEQDRPERIPLKLNDQQCAELREAGLIVNRFVPNSRAFNRILDALASAPTPTPAAVAPCETGLATSSTAVALPPVR